MLWGRSKPDYIRPPIVALEPPSRRLAVWRFRLVLLLLFAALAIGTFLLVRAFLDSNQNGNAQGSAVRPAAVMTR